jgi:hypothetical protein
LGRGLGQRGCRCSGDAGSEKMPAGNGVVHRGHFRAAAFEAKRIRSGRVGVYAVCTRFFAGVDNCI